MLESDSSIQSVQITICGRVQGVGFRPFIYRLAQIHNIAGTIKNTCSGITIRAEGNRNSISMFCENILKTKPSQAAISEFTVREVPFSRYTNFEIVASHSDPDASLALLPDAAMCSECLKELFNPENRRFQYPFLHCISCGPRFSLFLSMPFDRGNTTMKTFSMCSDCVAEYSNPENRRFYSQTNCCPACGPSLKLVNAKGKEIVANSEAIDVVVKYLQEGKIVAMKNTGGFILLADATSEETVQLLRKRKCRLRKPFALLMPSVEAIKKIAHVNPLETDILTSSAAPIVLLKKRSGPHKIASSVAHESPYYGMMIPHNPIQHLLLYRFGKPLVATSGNISGSPLCITEQEAFDTLSSVADVFLIHNRQIKHRLDDSIVHVIAQQPVVMRRARGYIPYAIQLPKQLTESLFAAGSHMKNSFAFLKQSYIYMSQHMGDLDSVDSCKAYDSSVNDWESLLGCKPTHGAGDSHPHYYSSQYLQRKNLISKSIQHHKAHLYAGLMDCKLSLPFLGISWDGTGWGDDGSIWGGESFLVTDENISRIASLTPFLLPGSERAVREPRRSMLGLLHSIYGVEIPTAYHKWLKGIFTHEELSVLNTALEKKINSPVCSSIGRLFDGVSALLGICKISDFEGEAALKLEATAYQSPSDGRGYSFPFVKGNKLLLMDWRLMIKEIINDKMEGKPLPYIAMKFHETLAEGIVQLAKEACCKNVLLSGGVMQNKLLVEKAVVKLKREGFNPYIHRDIPPGDGGIAVGQLVGNLHQNQRMKKICA